jgi:succinyl-diaminopimelate desuccinylase
VTDVLATDLLAATADLVSVPSVSHGERALADRVEASLAGRGSLEVVRIGDNVIARTRLGRAQRLLLAGHLDTVPPTAGNEIPRIEGDTCWGLGAADMKGGLAVMLDLAERVEDPALDLTWVFYATEEVARADNGLLAVAAARPDLLAADAAILGEPTGALVEAGCQGVLKVDIAVGGERAHTARPWMGRNAIHRLGPLLERLAGFGGREPEIDGCRYREAVEAVAVRGGVAGNVVPDSATVTVSHRFAPDHDGEQALAGLRSLIDGAFDPGLGDTLEVVDLAPAAPPGLNHPLLTRLLASTGAPPRAKLGWTDVAFFAERGVPAVNFGPGDPELAHRADEHVSREELDKVRRVLGDLVSS